MPRSLLSAAVFPPDFSPDFSPQAPALVGVSGGRDSVALLHWLRAQGCERLVVCHLNHGLRPESREEAEFVAALAREWGCEVAVSRAAVQARAQRDKQSIETAARAARLAFFERCARKYGTARLLLAHHADDQVETFLFNLLRGAGMEGLGGMQTESRLGRLQIVRPWLGVWREEIDAYVQEHQLPWREDASNASRAHTRNRLRHDGLPALSAAMGRDVRGALWRAAELIRAEADALSAMAGAEMKSVGAMETLPVAELRAWPLALQRRRILGWLRVRGVREVGFEEVEAVRSLLQMEVAKVNLPGQRHARRRAGRIFLT